VFIDWDGAAPGSRLWDLAYAITGFVPLHSHGDYWGSAADYIERHLDTWSRALLGTALGFSER
jgi:hypothetical protein